MTRVDYILVAGAFRTWRMRESASRASACEGLARVLADQFETDNPRFDRARFLSACGVKP